MKLEIESLGKSIQLHLSPWKHTQPGGGSGCSGSGCGSGGAALGSENSRQVTGQVSSQQFFGLMSGIVRVNKWRIGLGFVVVFIIVFFGFFSFFGRLGYSRGLTSGGNMITTQDAETVDSGLVTNRVGFAVVANVRVLSDTLVISSNK